MFCTLFMQFNQQIFMELNVRSALLGARDLLGSQKGRVSVPIELTDHWGRGMYGKVPGDSNLWWRLPSSKQRVREQQEGHAVPSALADAQFTVTLSSSPSGISLRVTSSFSQNYPSWFWILFFWNWMALFVLFCFEF